MTDILSLLKQRNIQIIFGAYVFGLSYWMWMHLTGNIEGVFILPFIDYHILHSYFWSLMVIGIAPFLAGISGILLSRKWGFLGTSLGRAIFFLSAGVAVWGLGSIIWAYYNFVLAVEVPYPSWADVGYLLSYPFYAIGLINLGKGIGAYHKLKTKLGRVALVAVPIVGLALTYFVFITVARQGELDFQNSSPLKLLFDVGYPLGDAIILTAISLVYGLSYRIFGGRFKWPINLLFIGQFLVYLSDFGFSYTTTQGTFYVAGWSDFILLNGLLLLSISVNAFDIQGISSRAREELTMFAPRATEAINNLALEIIQSQSRIIGSVAWDEATKVSGLVIDVENNHLYVEGDPKVVLSQLVGRYEDLFGGASLEICREAARKMISQVPREQMPSMLI